MKRTVSAEISVSLGAERSQDLPLLIYDALYDSGLFDPIFRLQGDMVLGAYYAGERQRRRVRSVIRRVLKELTIDVRERIEGTEVRVENLFSVTEEEDMLFRNPSVRLLSRTESRASELSRSMERLFHALDAAERILLSTGKLKPSREIRVSLNMKDLMDEYERNRLHAELSKHSKCSVSKNTITLFFDQEVRMKILSSLAENMAHID